MCKTETSIEKMSSKMVGRLKCPPTWKDCPDKEKIERMRCRVKSMEHKIESLQRSMSYLLRHHHGPDGQPSSYLPYLVGIEGIPAMDKDDVWF